MPGGAGSRTRKRPKARWLSADEEAVWRTIATTMTMLRWALECQLEHDSGLSFIEYHALARLSEEPHHTLRMGELAVATNGSLSRLSHLVNRLEKWGFGRREADPRDGRFTNAVLTKAGHAKLVASAPAHVEKVRSLVIDEFSPAEFRQLGEALQRVLARVVGSPRE